MPLSIKPFGRWNRPVLATLIENFNKTPQNDPIQRLFYLQKINYFLNKAPVEMGLFGWMSAHEEEKESWNAQLVSHNINPDGSFLFKGIQFAKAVAAQVHEPVEKDGKDAYQLMQERDELLRSDLSFEECQQRFKAISYRLAQLAEHDTKIQNAIKKHAEILHLATDMIEEVKGFLL